MNIRTLTLSLLLLTTAHQSYAATVAEYEDTITELVTNMATKYKSIIKNNPEAKKYFEQCINPQSKIDAFNNPRSKQSTTEYIHRLAEYIHNNESVFLKEYSSDIQSYANRKDAEFKTYSNPKLLSIVIAIAERIIPGMPLPQAPFMCIDVEAIKLAFNDLRNEELEEAFNKFYN